MTKQSGRGNRSGTILIILGLLMITAALLLIAYNRYDADFAEKDAAYYERAIERAMETYVAPDEEEEESLAEETRSVFLDIAQEQDELREQTKKMPLVTVNGYDCIGILHVPYFSLDLPIMYNCDYERLRKSPCRYYGSYLTDDLVICGHNYRRHFSLLRSLPLGEPVQLEAVDGTIYNYEVINIETLKDTDISRMIEDENGEWDMTLFTCTIGGGARYAIRCMKKL